eukprot:CAMPEP_0182441062 /NCGR_PEP_ID=MMETSP1172-20130603/6_1 /TAXON_ID=708627 /ORGANISM="Timspurckia oligopyrenoides, Strain CCMP3278" /LENGTH=146 /DNA_ID=CAMNT_0024635203 /DNA_START=42 /DNA_END=479 /DNA_ORIENTATION=-
MHSYKLIYFPIKGRAEAIRYVLEFGDIEYDDYRMPSGLWPELKPKTPFGSVPVLEIDGVQYAQSMAILRYAGKITGLYPKENDIEALYVDQFLAGFDDISSAIAATNAAKSEEEKLEMRKNAADTKIKGTLTALNALVKGDFVLGD